MGIPPNLLTLAHKAATAQSLDPALVCAVVEQESGWNPWAMRYEPAFFTRYVAPLYTNNKITATEAWARGFSWGLMQVMGQVARESGFDAWRAERSDRAKLAAELATARQSLSQATDRQQSRDADLLRTLANLATQKREAQTSQQIVKALSQQIPLPQPITLMPPQPSAVGAASGSAPASSVADAPKDDGAQSKKPTAPEPQAVIPSADLKPLYDFAVDCKACQAKLVAAQSDLADEKSKTATLSQERDEAIRTSKGGSTMQRFARAAKWLLIGAAAGTPAARATR